MNLTSQYPLNRMQVGDSFQVFERFQHARVAASEYARKNGCCFTCRMQDDHSMIIYRVENNQIPVDQRGARGRRRIVQHVNEPTSQQFGEWLATFAVGQSYTMPASYAHLYSAMVAWCELYSLRSGRSIVAAHAGTELIIQRMI